jgi:cellulose synthase/poly-beta-1,6-N-acetylglucosamine synthase-like glycosyltransferase
MYNPRILVAAPQSDEKNYCFEEWVMNVRRFIYPNDKIDILLCDNSKSEKNVSKIRNMGIECIYVKPQGKDIRELLAECHNLCLEYAKYYNYDYLFHLETDIFPAPNIIEQLLIHKKEIICGLYNIFNGAYREPSIRLVEKKNDGYMRAYGILRNYTLINEPLMKVYSGALGCTLIHKSIFNEIKFRGVIGEAQFPDTWFAQDMLQKKIPIYVSTKNICKHFNQNWKNKSFNFINYENL